MIIYQLFKNYMKPIKKGKFSQKIQSYIKELLLKRMKMMMDGNILLIILKKEMVIVRRLLYMDLLFSLFILIKID